MFISTLPPVMITPTRFPAKVFLFLRMVAKGTALDGSMTIFILCQISFIASTISCSLASRISSTWLETHFGASGGLLFSGVLFTYSGIHLIRVLSPLDLYPSVSRFFQQLPLLLNQNWKTGKRFQSRDSSIKKGPLVFQTRTSSNGKLNHPLQQTDE